MFSGMAAANASAGGQRSAILGSQLHELDGCLIAIDCGVASCRGKGKAYLVSELAAVHGKQPIVSDALRRTRCAGCGAA